MNQSGFDWAFQLHQSKASLVPTLRWTQHVLHHWLLPMQQLIWWSGNSQDRCAACRKDVGNVWKSGNLESTLAGWGFQDAFFFPSIFKPVRYGEMIQFDYIYFFILERFWVDAREAFKALMQSLCWEAQYTYRGEDRSTFRGLAARSVKYTFAKQNKYPPISFWAWFFFWRYFRFCTFWDALRCVRRTTWSIKHSWSMPCAWGSWWCFILVVGSVNAPPQCCPIRAVPRHVTTGLGWGLTRTMMSAIESILDDEILIHPWPTYDKIQDHVKSTVFYLWQYGLSATFDGCLTVDCVSETPILPKGKNSVVRGAFSRTIVGIPVHQLVLGM